MHIDHKGLHVFGGDEKLSISKNASAGGVQYVLVDIANADLKPARLSALRLQSECFAEDVSYSVLECSKEVYPAANKDWQEELGNLMRENDVVHVLVGIDWDGFPDGLKYMRGDLVVYPENTCDCLVILWVFDLGKLAKEHPEFLRRSADSFFTFGW